MKFVVVDPKRKVLGPIEAESFEAALAQAGLRLGNVDHGRIDRVLSIVVEENSMFKHPQEQDYFRIAYRLYAGPALLYAVDDKGYTVDLHYVPQSLVRFYDSVGAIERAIRRKEVDRPHVGVGDKVFWRWPGDGNVPDLTPVVEAMVAHTGPVVVDDDITIVTMPPTGPKGKARKCP